MVLSDNGKTSRYTYNHAGERVVKSHGSMEGVYINGAPQGITFHETDEYTLYPASILSVTKNRFTKHYFIGSKRIASRIGSGSFNNMYGVNGSHVTAGQQDYAERLSQIESQKEDYYKKLGIAPGIPTMKGSYADPENTGVGYNTIIKELGDHSVPAEWAQYVKKNTEADTAPGAPIAWDDPSDPDEAQPGYGYVADSSSSEEETYFFHSDHLGSTSYITDKDGNITQYDAYLPYGELLVDEHSSSEEMPYKFNGKEFDEETGLYYYGARYMNPVASVWYGVDPLAEKYPYMGAYVYCAGNPIKLVDPDGKENIVVVGSQNNNNAGSKLMFVNQGVRALKELSQSDPSESRTMLLFKGDYTDKQINAIRTSVENYGGQLQILNSSSDLINYINTKTLNGDRNDRASDKITKMEIYSHGVFGAIEFGYGTENADKYRLDFSNVNLLRKSAFKGRNSHISSFACRTGLGRDYKYFGFYEFRTSSLAQAISNSTQASVSAFAVRTDYQFTLGSWSERRFGYPNPAPKTKSIDGAIFTPQGAAHPVQSGSTPMFLYNGMIEYYPKKN